MRKASLIVALVAGVLGASASFANAATFSPIHINGDADFTMVGDSSGCKCVTSIDANGTYVIANWNITANGVPGVLVANTTKPFRLDHITVHTSGNAPGIQLQSVSHAQQVTSGAVASVTYPNIATPPSTPLAAGNIGIEIDNSPGVSDTSPGVSVTGGSVNNLGDWGIRVSDSPYVRLNGVQVSHTGLINPNSESTPGLYHDLDNNPWLRGLVGDAPGGVLLINSGNSLLQNVGATSDAYAGIELVRSDYDTLDGVNTNYPDYYGLAMQSSNNNTIKNSRFVASDYDGVLLRDSSNNTVTNNFINANSPIGTEFPKQIVGYFAAGLYVGWQSAGNLIKGNSGKNLAPSVEIDDGNVAALSAPSAQGKPQTLNPLNDPSSGGDPFFTSPQWYPSLANGATWALEMPPGSPVAGIANHVCGNSFGGAASYPPELDPNASCQQRQTPLT